MKGYMVRMEWRGILDPDNTGTEEAEFLAYNDEHARNKARNIACKQSCRVKEVLRATDDGFAEV